MGNRRKTRQVKVGAVALGGDAPVSVQSMTSTHTWRIDETAAQIRALEAAGADLVRVAVPDARDTAALPEILRQHGVYSHLDSDHYHYWEDGGLTYHQRYNSFEINRGQEGDFWKGDLTVKPNEASLNTKRIGGHWGRQDWVNRKYMADEADHCQTRTFAQGMEVGRKIWNWTNAIWALQGRSRDMVKFSGYVYDVPDKASYYLLAFEGGKWIYKDFAGRTVDRQKFEDWKTKFYELEGWDTKTGWPTKKTLEAVGLKNVADFVESKGKLGAA